MERRIPYGISNYEEAIKKQAYIVDKTRYIQNLETIQNPVFLRPRRFGKSLFCSMLQSYYDLLSADLFSELFQSSWIGTHPTPEHNKYIVLHLDFSVIENSGSFPEMKAGFETYCNTCLTMLKVRYPGILDKMPDINPFLSSSSNLIVLLEYIRAAKTPQLYVIIDEYDNFANQFIITCQDAVYEELTAGDSFLRTFFKILKRGRQSGAIAQIFITGVLPIAIDDLASGYNIGTFLTLDPEFEHMMGFTKEEVETLVTRIYEDYGFDFATKTQVLDVITSQYDGYHPATTDSESLYNPTMLMFFFRQFCQTGLIPDQLTDLNLRTDLGFVKRITGMRSEDTEAFIRNLTLQDTIPYDTEYLVTKFNMSQFFQKSYFPISFFYLGLLTRNDEFTLSVPNLNVRKIITEYLNELYHIDVSTRYEDMMRRFIARPDISVLFADYWSLYVSQLPEVIFMQVQENFYRTTFYELCSRYLSRWFTWNLERSYPKGRSDLEFVGKYLEKFANLRIIIEFKYISNSEFIKRFQNIDAITLKDEDVRQIDGYVAGLKKEYPEVTVQQYVIYCVGNLGYKVFELDN